MKNRVFIALVAAIALAFLLVACNGGGSATNYSIVGKWQIFEKNGVAEADEMSKQMIFDFTADGKINIMVGNMTAGNFEYTTDDSGSINHIIISIPEENEQMYGAYSFEESGNVLVLKTNNQGKDYPTNMDIENGFTVEKYRKATE